MTTPTQFDLKQIFNVKFNRPLSDVRTIEFVEDNDPPCWVVSLNTSNQKFEIYEEDVEKFFTPAQISEPPVEEVAPEPPSPPSFDE